MLGGIFFVIVLLGTIYFYIIRKKDVLDIEKLSVSTHENVDSGEKESVLPEGVVVREFPNKKFLRDENAKYEIEIPVESKLEEFDGGVLLSYIDNNTIESNIIGATIKVFQRDNLSLEEWVSRYHREEPFIFYDERKRMDTNFLDIIKIPIDGPGLRYEYFVPIKNVILKIQSVGDEFFDTAVQQITILK